MALLQALRLESSIMTQIICPFCGKEMEVRSGFAYQSLSKHINENHKERIVK